MTLFDVLPSLRSACPSRFESGLWPVDTHYLYGRVTVNGVALEDVADSCSTPVSVEGVLVTRVRSVLCGRVTVDGCVEGTCAAVIANRHSLQAAAHFGVVGTGGFEIDVDLPADVRAGDVLALPM